MYQAQNIVLDTAMTENTYNKKFFFLKDQKSVCDRSFSNSGSLYKSFSQHNSELLISFVLSQYFN